MKSNDPRKGVIESKCPYCQGVLNAALSSNPRSKDRPQDGDITFCLHCAGLLIFDSGSVRFPTDNEARAANRRMEVRIMRARLMHLIGHHSG